MHFIVFLVVVVVDRTTFDIFVRLRFVYFRSDSLLVVHVTDPNQQQQFYGGGQPYPQPGFAPGYGQPQPGYPGGGYPGGGGGYPPQQPGYPPQQPGYLPQGGGIDGPSYGGGDANAEAKGFEFNDESIRRGFIRKVYAILMVSAMTQTFSFFRHHFPIICSMSVCDFRYN